MEYLGAGLIALVVMVVVDYLFNAGVQHMYGSDDNIIDFGDD
jgi:hypothetical protein